MSKILKIFLSILFSILILFSIVFAVLPTFISSSYGTQILTRWINSQIKGNFCVEKVKLSWLGTQHFENIIYNDEKGITIFNCQLFETKTPLIYLALGKRALKDTTIVEPYVKISAYSSSIKEEHPQKEKKAKKKPLHFFTFEKSLILTHGSAVLASENTPSITISDIYINKSASPQHLSIQATTFQNNVLGSLTVEAVLEEKLQAKVNIHDFPIEILNNLTESKLYTEAFGQTLNLELDILRENQDSLYINGLAKSANLSAYINGTTQKEQFIINPETHLDFIITPSFFKQITDEKKRGDWELASKVNLSILVEKGSFSLKRNFGFKNLNLKARAIMDRAELHHKAVGSYSFKQFDASINACDQLEIIYQGELQGKEATKLVGTLAITPSKDFFFDYRCKGFPVTLLELISEQLSSKVRLVFGNQFDMEGKGKMTGNVMDSYFSLCSRDTELNGHVIGTLPELHFDLSGLRRLQGDKTQVLGNSVNFTLSGLSEYDQNSVTIPFLKGHAFNSFFEIDLTGQIGKKGKPITLEQMQISALGYLKKLPFDENQVDIALENSTIYIQVDGSKNQITGKAENKGLEANFTVKNFITEDSFCLDKANVFFSCNISDFPLSALTPFVSDELDLKTLFGKKISLTAKGTYTPQEKPRLSLDLNAKGTGLASSLSIAVDESLVVRQNRPSYIYWEITPERFAALSQIFYGSSSEESNFSLVRPTQIELNITQFTCPTSLPKNISHFLCQSGFVGDLKMGTMNFYNQRTQESLTFQKIAGLIKGENFSKAIDLSLSGNILAEGIPTSEQSAFTFAGQMFNFWSREGKFNREGLTFKGELNVNLLPVRQITGIFPDHETRAILQAVLGEFINAHVSGEISQLSGPITVDLKSSNFKAKLPLQLQKNAFYLRDYIDAEISLNESVNETLLKDINPLIITGAFSEHPIKVYIDPQGFMLPIKPYSLEKVQIGKAIVDIGKIRIRNGGQIQALMQFLNAKEISTEGLMEAWFTPIFMSLQNGIASYKRFDALLASNVHIAMWGSINLINDRVKMTLAIAPTTLYQRFKVSGLTKKDMFQVQMQGTTTKLELDWSSAYTRIAFIMARNAGGHLGYIVGGILEQLIGNLGDATPPPSTTDPLPWENSYPSEPGNNIPQEAPTKEGKKKARKWIDFLIP